MIFETASYTNNAGTTLAIGDTNYPALEFEMKTYLVNDPVKKTQFPGRWPTFSYPEYREIYFAGDILGDDAADYNALARALKAAFHPPYQVLTGRRHGRLNLTFYGDATTYYAYVILGSLETPKQANYPSVGSYTLTLISFEPYLVNATTGAFAVDL